MDNQKISTPTLAKQCEKKPSTKKKSKPKVQWDKDWVKAKEKCRLNQKDIEMAKQLGFKPRTLMGSIPNPKQCWKVPVKQWIHDLYEERFGKQHP